MYAQESKIDRLGSLKNWKESRKSAIDHFVHIYTCHWASLSDIVGCVEILRERWRTKMTVRA